MKINWQLKAALVREFGSQVEAARKLGIREAKLSYIVRGHVQPSKVEREALEGKLGKVHVRRLLRQ